MEAKLERRFEILERKKAALFERLDGLSDEVLNRSPAAGEWSVVQVLGHLCLAEELSVRYLRQKMSPDAPQAGLIHRLKSTALSLALRSPLRFKAPPMSAEVPGDEPLEAVRSRWDGVRMDLAGVLEETPPEVARRAVFRHPRVGMLNYEQALRFMEDHLDHHQHQVERVLKRVA